MKKELLFGSEAKNKIEAGIDKLADAVRVTLGAKGRNVLLQREHLKPLITNDGVTIAKAIELEDEFENIGAELVKEVAIKTNDDAGDGTTTATILAHAIFKNGLKNIVAGANPILLNEGIKLATDVVVSSLKNQAKVVAENSEIKNVATISANSEFIGEIIADAMAKVGINGVITTEKSNTFETTLKIVEGLQFDRGYISPYMVSGKEKVEIKDCFILTTNKTINNLGELKDIIEFVIAKNRTLIIIAEDIVGNALNDIIINNMKGVFNVIGVKSDGFGNRKDEFLMDVAIATGGKTIVDGIHNFSTDCLGKAEQITISKSSTTIINNKIDKEKYLVGLKKELEAEKSEFMKEKLRERIAKLSSGIAIIKVGGYTESENEELALRIEDALNSTKSAIEEGIIAGGGVALLMASVKVEDYYIGNGFIGDVATGIKIVKDAVKTPFYQLVENAGLNGEVVYNDWAKKDFGFGFDVKNDIFVDMFEAGIVDAVKVTRSAVQNASSIAQLLLSSEVVITHVKTE